uniref:Uncharacterized protein n=1 Tax=Geladintestivirus 1 TaxID=3233133 RepID=A0AAU8MHZ6_9CAUD
MVVKVDKKIKEVLKDYVLDEFDDFLYDILLYDISNKGFKKVFEDNFKTIQCNRWDDEHKHRIMQTIGLPYQVAITKLIVMLDLYPEKIPDGLERILDMHNNNLQYEKDNPPEIYIDKTSTTKNKSKSKSKSKPKKEQTPKITKEMKKALRFANVEFKIKI